MKGFKRGFDTISYMLLNNYCGHSVESELGVHSGLHARVQVEVA